MIRCVYVGRLTDGGITELHERARGSERSIHASGSTVGRNPREEPTTDFGKRCWQVNFTTESKSLSWLVELLLGQAIAIWTVASSTKKDRRDVPTVFLLTRPVWRRLLGIRQLARLVIGVEAMLRPVNNFGP